MANLTIKAADLEKVMHLVSKHISFYIGDSITLEKDYYWNLNTAEAFDLKEKIEPMVGSLHDDWASLIKLLDHDSQPASIDLDRLASVIRAISDNINPA